MTRTKVSFWGGPHDGAVTHAIERTKNPPNELMVHTFYDEQGNGYGKMLCYELYGQWTDFKSDTDIIVYKFLRYTEK